MTYKVFIDGKQGTTGLKIDERLNKRKDIELITLSENLRKDTNARKKAINESDVTFLCLPDNAAIESVSLLEKNSTTKIIDASTAHRTDERWAYGFPELSDLYKNKIQTSNLIAVPGCHASGFNAIAYPLISRGIMPNDYPITCHSITGYSGGGKQMINEYENPVNKGLLKSPRQYALTQNHKHQKEMQFVSNLQYTPIINPIVSDFFAGMVVTVPIYNRLLKKKLNAIKIHEFFSNYYSGSNFIKVLPFIDESNNILQDGFLATDTLKDTNNMEIIISGGDDRTIIATRFDNLGKGSSGAAIQCFNIALGLEETISLI